MGFISRLFGPRSPAAAMPKAVSAVLAWSGSYEIRVAGGSKHQRELAELFEKFTSGRAEAYCVAGLVREPNGAVRVQIDERTVGYLDPITAAEYCRGMRAMGKSDEIEGVGMAQIANDGWHPDERFVANLDLKWPVEEHPA